MGGKEGGKEGGRYECHQLLLAVQGISTRFSYGRGWNFPQPQFSPTEILKLSMVINILSQVLNNNLVPDCVRSNLRGSKFKIFLEGHAPRHP